MKTIIYIFILINLIITNSFALNHYFKIGFGSCNDQKESQQSMWDVILAQNIDLWIWLGDNIYADTTTNPEHIKNQYNKQLLNVDYQKFLSQNIPMLGIWDDHDYGLNDAGKNYIFKDISQQYFSDFFNLPSNDPRRHRPGVYFSQDFLTSKYKIKFILLDTRYFRDDPGPTSDILGNDQWLWLENLLEENKKNPADFVFIASGIQVISNVHPDEHWGHFPQSRHKLFDLINEYKLNNPIILSGDMHWGEIQSLNNIIEVTSSGLTHFNENDYVYNPYRFGPPLSDYNIGVIDIYEENNYDYVSFRLVNVDNIITNELTYRLVK